MSYPYIPSTERRVFVDIIPELTYIPICRGKYIKMYPGIFSIGAWHAFYVINAVMHTLLDMHIWMGRKWQS